MNQVTVFTEYADSRGIERTEYQGYLVDDEHAIYVDAAYSVVVMERVMKIDEGKYRTSGGYGSVLFELQVKDAPLIKDQISMISLKDFLCCLIPKNA